MKRLLLFLFITFSLSSFAQKWETGTTWVYELKAMLSYWQGLDIYTVKGDTLVNGESFQVIGHFTKGRDTSWSNKIDTSYYADQYIQYVSDTVYFLNGVYGKETLIVFDTSIGVNWSYHYWEPCSEYEIARSVYKSSETQYNSNTFIKTEVFTPSQSGNTELIQGVGYLNEFFPDYCVLDAPANIGLLCFRNGPIKIGEEKCEDKFLERLSVSESRPHHAYEVLNKDGKISLKFYTTGNYRIDLIDVIGRELFTKELNGNTIDLPEFNSISFVRVRDLDRNTTMGYQRLR